MTTELFFSTVSKAIGGSIFQIIGLVLILGALIGYILYLTVWKPRRYMRAKTDSLIGFLRQRHGLSDPEWESLVRSARRAGVTPDWLVAVSEAAFDEAREALRHDLNDDVRVEDLAFKLFNK